MRESFKIENEELFYASDTENGFDIFVNVSAKVDYSTVTNGIKTEVTSFKVFYLNFDFVKKDKQGNILDFTEEDKKVWNTEPNCQSEIDVIEDIILSEYIRPLL